MDNDGTRLMASMIVKYKEKIPAETRSILDALSEPTRQGLAMMLAERGELSFNALLQAAKPMNASTLNHHIKALMKAGLVKNYYRKVEGKDDYSFYQITDLGRDFLKQIGAL